jgi:hypothetical protein
MGVGRGPGRLETRLAFEDAPTTAPVRTRAERLKRRKESPYDKRTRLASQRPTLVVNTT